MAIDKWSPFQDLLDVERDMSRFFGRMVAPTRRTSTVWTPTMEMYAKGSDMIVKLELAGLEPGNVDISVADNVLTVTGERKQTEEVKDEDYYRSETSYGRFQRSVSLPAGVMAENIKAKFENGILEITVPQAAAISQPQRVPIESAEKTKVQAEIK